MSNPETRLELPGYPWARGARRECCKTRGRGAHVRGLPRELRKCAQFPHEVNLRDMVVHLVGVKVAAVQPCDALCTWSMHQLPA